MKKINVNVFNINNNNINFVLEPINNDGENTVFRIMYYDNKSEHKEYIEQTISNISLIGINAQIKRILRYSSANILHTLLPEDIVYNGTNPSKIIKRFAR